jgi:CheY-like chemotaxis protein
MCKLLIIDDNPMEHLMMQRLFVRYDLFRDADHSFDVEGAIEYIISNRYNINQLPDLIFLDLNMPHYNGWIFLEKFKEHYPIIAKNINIYITYSSVDRFEKWRLKAYPFIKNFYHKPIESAQMEMLYRIYQNTDRMTG